MYFHTLWGFRTLVVYSMSHRCELTSFVLHTLFIYLGWHTLYQPVDKQGKERRKGLPRFLAVFDTVSVAAVVRRTTAYTPPAARRTVGLFGGKNARNLA